MAEIAFFGLGTMGTPMAKNLLKAGHTLRVMVYQGLVEAPREVQKLGAIIDERLEDMVGTADFVISIVPNDASVREVYMNQAMHDAVKEGAIFIEMTSCSPQVVVEVQEYYADRKVRVIDAPITGALPKAIDGTLTVMGAGDAEAFAAAKDVFAPIAEKVLQLGKVGNGKLIKAMTNLLGAINLAAVGEFYRFAQARGLDMAQLAQVVPASAGGSTQFSRNFDKIVQGNYAPTFALSLLRKDMGIALDCAAMDQDLDMPLARCAYELYKKGTAYDREDCCAIAKVDGK